jgi:hypothetical protein
MTWPRRYDDLGDDLMDLLLDLMKGPAWVGNPGATEQEISELLNALEIPLPQSFLDFLSTYNGGSGGVGDKCEVLRIMSVDEILRYQQLWEVNDCIPGAILFGSDSGDFALLFNTKDGLEESEYPVIMCPFSSLSVADSEQICSSFPECFYKMRG